MWNIKIFIALEVALFTRAWIEIRWRNMKRKILNVALFTRAWIEIIGTALASASRESRPLYEGVDWNDLLDFLKLPNMCRPLYEGVDWNDLLDFLKLPNMCRPLYEGVDWNQWRNIKRKTLNCRPLYEGVDWNIRVWYNIDNETRSPSLRGRGLKCR